MSVLLIKQTDVDKDKAEDLLARYLKGEVNSIEKKQVEDWYNFLAKKNNYDFSDTDFSAVGKKMKRTLPKPVFTLRLFYRTAAAAVLLVVCSFAIKWFASSNGRLEATHIKPGTQTATLILANGQQIALTDSVTGTVKALQGLKIINRKNHQLAVEVIDDVSENASALHSLVTGAGQQYQLLLPDGSKIWLNSQTVLKFPSSFKHKTTRRVQLQGEAYFEIAKNAKQPFIVQLANQQEIEVLGTQFVAKTNHTQQQYIKTYLVEGSVKLTAFRHQKVLSPGQEAKSSKQGIVIAKGDAEELLDWKNGDFVFHSRNLKEVMEKLAMWYNVKVVYRTEIDPKSTYSGQIARTANISEILKSLENTMNVKFIINNNQITVTNN
jgi:hypothetical protein